MRLLYATSIRFPSPLANRVQILETSKEFFSILKDDFILGIGENRDNMPIACPVFSTGTGMKSYKLAYFYIQYAHKNHFKYIFCREEKLLFFMLVYKGIFFWRPKIDFVFEIHDLNNRTKWWHKYVLKKVDKIVAITSGIKKILVSLGVKNEKILVASSAVDIKLFDLPIDKREARLRVGLPIDKKIILSNSSLEKWKGIHVLYEASREFDDDYLFVNVGGRDTWVEEFKGWYPPKPNFLMVGHRDHAEIPLYLKSADVLVIPNSAKVEISKVATSPMKLFEYMASKKPIVASDIPSIREVLDDSMAKFVLPDDSLSLAMGIKDVLNNAHLGNAISESAYNKVQDFTWKNRAESIINFIK